jgi:uncharacterized membrane protein
LYYDSRWTNTLVPRYNGDMNMDFSYGRNSLTMNVDAGFSKEQRLKLTQSGNVDLTSPDKIIDGLLKLELPGVRINV